MRRFFFSRTENFTLTSKNGKMGSHHEIRGRTMTRLVFMVRPHFSIMNKYMQAALEEARLGMNKGHGGPFGAVIVRDGKIIARAHNKVLQSFDPTAHAEIEAIRSASAKLKRCHLPDCTLYTTCEPCPMCLGAVYWARIPQIYYGCTRKDADMIGFSDAEIYEFMCGQKTAEVKLISLDRDPCLQIFREWERISGKKLY